jgi:hypothetical protein
MSATLTRTETKTGYAYHLTAEGKAYRLYRGKNYSHYIERIAQRIAEWRAEYGYIKMCQLVDFQKIGQRWRGLAAHGSESHRRAEVEKIVTDHFETLQRKVESKIGKILTIEPTGDNGADYYFTGESGNVEIRVVAAGGYNIQCAHTRWIFIKR